MTFKKILCLLALTLFGASFQSCTSAVPKNDLRDQPAAQNQTSPQPDSQQANETVVPAPSEFKETFVGVIGDKYAIYMQLERQGTALTGNFSYDQAGAVNSEQTTLELKGRIGGDGNVTLTNYETATSDDENVRKTNEFKGKLDALSADGEVTLRFSGLWTRKDEKPTPFSLRQLRFDLGRLKLEEKKEESANKKLHYEIKMALPHLAGADSTRAEKFNQTVANLAAVQTKEFKQRVNEYAPDDVDKWKSKSPPPPYSLNIRYKVIAIDKDFISILFSCRVYYGGAHGYPFTKSLNYDLNRNAPASLADFFTPHSNYLMVISDYSIEELKKLETMSGMMIEGGAGPTPENFHSWNTTPIGLKITFDASQVSSFAAGEHTVVIPYSVLKLIIRAAPIVHMMNTSGEFRDCRRSPASMLWITEVPI